MPPHRQPSKVPQGRVDPDVLHNRMTTRPLQFRASGWLDNAVRAAAAADGRTVSSVLTEAVERWVLDRKARVLGRDPYTATELIDPAGYSVLGEVLADDTYWEALYPGGDKPADTA